ncbi:hypothetical protein [Actinoplanes subglobosus]|uniref:Uncharacterized protein n=1 Tax=Actinoplanes subglobosus TaxID=1547892 RepID=A0ABV8J5A4_9ACTN
MEPLRDVFAGLAGNGGDPGDFLRDLPADLVAEAVVSYADTAPLEVAEHLAPFVAARFDESDASETWLDLLASAPVEEEASGPEDLGFGTGYGTAVDDMTRFDVHDDGIDIGLGDPATPAAEHGLDDLGGDDLDGDWPEFGDDDADDDDPDDALLG